MPDTPFKLMYFYALRLMTLSGHFIFIYKELESVKNINNQNARRRTLKKPAHLQTELTKTDRMQEVKPDFQNIMELMKTIETL